MDELKYKINRLEEKVSTVIVEGCSTTSTIVQIKEEAEILESLSFLYKNSEFIKKIEKIKEKAMDMLNVKIDTSIDRKNRIEIIGKKTERVLQLNSLIKECTDHQLPLINTVEFLVDDADQNIEAANFELIQYQKYLDKRGKLLRNIFYLCMVFVSLIVIKFIL